MSKDYDEESTLEQRVGQEEQGLSGKVRRAYKKYSSIFKFNASLFTGEGAAAVYGWLCGAPVATFLDKTGMSDGSTALLAHGADYVAHAAGVGAALYFFFRDDYETEQGTFDREHFVKDNVKLQLAHVGVDVITYALRIAGSYYALRKGIHPALVMTGSSIGGEMFHWTCMNVVGKRLGYFHDHHHGSHYTDKTPS